MEARLGVDLGESLLGPGLGWLKRVFIVVAPDVFRLVNFFQLLSQINFQRTGKEELGVDRLIHDNEQVGQGEFTSDQGNEGGSVGFEVLVVGLRPWIGQYVGDRYEILLVGKWVAGISGRRLRSML